MYMYICIYVYMYICIYVYMYICIYVYMYTISYIHTHMHIRITNTTRLNFERVLQTTLVSSI